MEPYDTDAAQFIDERRKDQIKSVVYSIIEDEYEHMKDNAGYYISQTAAERAEKFFERVLAGEDDAAMSLLGSRDDGDRIKQFGHDPNSPWAHLIHGRLFETKGVAMRRKIVEANRDLIESERIKDLESIVEGLSQQIRKIEAEKDSLYERLR